MTFRTLWHLNMGFHRCIQCELWWRLQEIGGDFGGLRGGGKLGQVWFSLSLKFNSLELSLTQMEDDLFHLKNLLSFLITNKTIEQSTPRESPQPRNTKVPPILLNVSIDVGILTLKRTDFKIFFIERIYPFTVSLWISYPFFSDWVNNTVIMKFHNTCIDLFKVRWIWKGKKMSTYWQWQAWVQNQSLYIKIPFFIPIAKNISFSFSPILLTWQNSVGPKKDD